MKVTGEDAVVRTDIDDAAGHVLALMQTDDRIEEGGHGSGGLGLHLSGLEHCQECGHG